VPAPTSQTLDRGLRLLELLAERPEGLSAAEIAGELRVDRAIVHRLLNTLLAHHLAMRDDDKRYRVGSAVVRLGRFAFGTLRAAAMPVLRRLARETGCTATLTIADGEDAVALATVEPPEPAGPFVMYHPGFRHPLDRGAPGIAILSSRPAVAGERDAVREARRRGYAVTKADLIAVGMSVAAPIRSGRAEATASVAAIRIPDLDPDLCGPAVAAAADAIAAALPAR
jgi:DNA-binding IclR family transcriptional regulator